MGILVLHPCCMICIVRVLKLSLSGCCWAFETTPDTGPPGNQLQGIAMPGPVTPDLGEGKFQPSRLGLASVRFDLNAFME